MRRNPRRRQQLHATRPPWWRRGPAVATAAIALLVIVAAAAYAEGLFLPSPLRTFGPTGDVPVVRAPTVADASLRVLASDGVTATLVGEGLPFATWPSDWLPDDVTVGDRVRLTTSIDPGRTVSRFEVAVETIARP